MNCAEFREHLEHSPFDYLPSEVLAWEHHGKNCDECFGIMKAKAKDKMKQLAEENPAELISALLTSIAMAGAIHAKLDELRTNDPELAEIS
jgi:hypothetical protein